jgi:predicted nucleotidyltransferase
MKTLDQISLKDSDRQAVREAANILRHQFSIEHIILFGSKARGEDEPESDIDLLVLTNGPVDHALKRQMTHAVFGIQLSHNVVLSMMVVPLEQWENGVYRVLSIHQEVLRDGVAA